MPVTLTTHQLFAVALVAGVFAALIARGLVLAWHAALWLAEHIQDHFEHRIALRARRKNLQICRAIDALGTTHHPKDTP